MRTVIGLLLLSSSSLACIGGSSGGGGCCPPSGGSACAPSAPVCGGGGSYPSASNSYPRPPIGAGGPFSSPPSGGFNGYPTGPSAALSGAPLGGASYQQSPLSLPSLGFPSASTGGSYQTGPSAGINGGATGSYQTGPSAGINGGAAGSYQAAPILSNGAQQNNGGSYQTGPSAGINGGATGSYQTGPIAGVNGGVQGGSYVAPAAVITTVTEEIKGPVVAPAYGEKAVINNGPVTATKTTETEVIADDGYGKEEEYEEVDQIKVTPAVPAATYEKPASVVTTVVEKHEEKEITGQQGAEYEYEEEETHAPSVSTPIPDNYKAAAVQQNGKTEHNAGSEASISAKEEGSVYSGEETVTQTAGASYEAVEHDGEAEIKQVEASAYPEKAVAETTYDDEETEKKTVEKEEYKRNSLDRA